MIVKINVGGELFVTRLQTLQSFGKDNLLTQMITQERIPVERIEDAIFLDRDPAVFRQILELLRQEDSLPFSDELPEKVKQELDFLQMTYPAPPNPNTPKEKTSKASQIADWISTSRGRTKPIQFDHCTCFAIQYKNFHQPIIKNFWYDQTIMCQLFTSKKLLKQVKEILENQHLKIRLQNVGMFTFWLVDRI